MNQYMFGSVVALVVVEIWEVLERSFRNSLEG